MKITIPIFAVALLLSACSGTPEKPSPETSVTAEDYDQTVSVDEDFVLPQPITLAEAFQQAGLTYKAGKTNPAKDKSNYSVKSDQLLNFGVYTTDLAYCAINNKTQEAREYLAAVQSLGSKLGLERIFADKAMIEKFDKNLGNPEALKDLIYEIQEKTDAYLQDNDLRHIAAIQFAGAWVEGMYLGIGDLKSKPGMATAMTDQMNLLENTLKGLNSYPTKDAKIEGVTKDLNELLATYNNLESVKKAQKNPNYKTPVLTAAEFDKLAAEINAIRMFIVQSAKK